LTPNSKSPEVFEKKKGTEPIVEVSAEGEEAKAEAAPTEAAKEDKPSTD